MTPFFSVIIPTYNRWPVLYEAIASVLEQTCRDLELLIIDDGSTDDTRNQVQKLALSPGSLWPGTTSVHMPIRLLNCDRGGPARARNVGLREARGAFVAFLDSDDLWLPNHLEEAHSLISRQPRPIDFCFADTQFSRAAGLRASYVQGKPIEAAPHERDGHWRIFHHTIYPELVQASTVSTSSAIIRRELLQQLGGFDERLTPFGEDTDLWLRVAAVAQTAGNWSVTVQRRKRSDGLMYSGQNLLWRSKHIELFSAHLRTPGQAYKRLIAHHLAELYRERAILHLQVRAYGAAMRDIVGLARYAPMALPTHLRILMRRAGQWLRRRTQHVPEGTARGS